MVPVKHIKAALSAAKRLEKRAISWSPGGRNYAYGDAKDMQRMYISDAKAFIKFANFLIAGKVKHAYNLLYRMDTAAREELASKTFYWIIDQVDY